MPSSPGTGAGSLEPASPPEDPVEAVEPPEELEGVPEPPPEPPFDLPPLRPSTRAIVSLAILTMRPITARGIVLFAAVSGTL